MHGEVAVVMRGGAASGSRSPAAWSPPEARCSFVRGVIAGANAAGAAMTAHGGAILNVNSTAALAPVPGLAVYPARGAMARGTGLLHTLGLRLSNSARKTGERRQRDASRS